MLTQASERSTGAHEIRDVPAAGRIVAGSRSRRGVDYTNPRSSDKHGSDTTRIPARELSAFEVSDGSGIECDSALQ